MAFLDNSGDIILDAVLTDLGRKRLAAGNFNIAKFALGDEEINYKLWNPKHDQGSTHYDLEIMQTPILEAFTSDQSLMKSRLLTFDSDSVVYLPTLKVNDKITSCKPYPNSEGFYLMADTKTHNVNGAAGLNNNDTTGVLNGTRGQPSKTTTHIAIDQGIDSSEIGQTVADIMPKSLEETKFIVKVDERLLLLEGMDSDGSVSTLSRQFVDDDNIATYYIVSSGNRPGPIMSAAESGNPLRVRDLRSASIQEDDLTEIQTHEMFNGPLGSVLRLVPRATGLISRSQSLFDEFGSVGSSLSFRGSTITSYKYIDTTISVAGATTGFSIDVPIRIIKGIF